MNREILFRGKSYTDDKWHYGFYVHRHGMPFTTERHEIDDGALGWNCYPDTIGQFTGLTDKNGNKIFEGDIVDILCENEEAGLIEWDKDTARFIVSAYSFEADFDNYYGTDLEVIGNVYEDAQAEKGEAEHV